MRRDEALGDVHAEINMLGNVLQAQRLGRHLPHHRVRALAHVGRGMIDDRFFDLCSAAQFQAHDRLLRCAEREPDILVPDRQPYPVTLRRIS